MTGLLVGISNYRPPIQPLSGCVVDVEAIETVLRGRVPEELSRIRALRDNEATYAAVVDAFTTCDHLSYFSSEAGLGALADALE